MKCTAKILDNAVIGHAFAVLPFGDGFVGYAKHFAQLFLRKVSRAPLLCDEVANGSLVYGDAFCIEDVLSVRQR